MATFNEPPHTQTQKRLCATARIKCNILKPPPSLHFHFGVLTRPVYCSEQGVDTPCTPSQGRHWRYRACHIPLSRLGERAGVMVAVSGYGRVMAARKPKSPFRYSGQ
jgi:hypothetical protein